MQRAMGSVAGDRFEAESALAMLISAIRDYRLNDGFDSSPFPIRMEDSRVNP